MAHDDDDKEAFEVQGTEGVTRADIYKRLELSSSERIFMSP